MIRSRYLYFRKHHGRVQAALLLWLNRLAFVVRAAKAGAAGILGRSRTERAHARVLWGLAWSDPRQPLPHERVGPQAGAEPRVP